jgi:hypothetical protein
VTVSMTAWARTVETESKLARMAAAIKRPPRASAPVLPVVDFSVARVWAVGRHNEFKSWFLLICCRWTTRVFP